MALPYYNLATVPSVFACLTLVLSACLRASKDTVTPLLVSAASNILNIVLDALFLHFGMGIQGLALATTLSRILACLFLLARLFGKTEGIKLSFQVFRPNRELLMGIWIGYALNNVVRSIFLYYRFRSVTWTKIKL